MEETDLPAKKLNLNVDKARCLQLIVHKSLKMSDYTDISLFWQK